MQGSEPNACASKCIDVNVLVPADFNFVGLQSGVRGS